jgi:hypothetical protein
MIFEKVPFYGVLGAKKWVFQNQRMNKGGAKES